MDMLAFLQDSTDEDSESVKSTPVEATDSKETICSSTAIDCDGARYGNKIRRRGCIQLISSSKAKDSEIFSRSTPHRRGHWAGHVKIPILTKTSLFVDDNSLQRRKTDNVKAFRDLLERRGISGTLVEHEYLHLSLSKEFSLQVSQIEPFIQKLMNFVQHEHSMSLRIDSISASEIRSRWDNGSIHEMLLLNEEKTRSFLCWNVHSNVTLRRIVAHIDNVMKSYKQPVYYEPAKFHVSIASFPGNLREKLSADKRYLTNSNIGDNDKYPAQTPAEHMCDMSDLEGIGKNDTGQNIEENDSSSSESTSSSSFLVHVNELECTFGTTKTYSIPFRDNKMT